MNRIKEILENKGIKQTWLAEKLDKSYNMVNSYVKNRRQPSLKDLFKIAKKFIEYAIFNKSKKVSFYFGVGKRWIVIRKTSIVLEELMNATHLCYK